MSFENLRKTHPYLLKFLQENEYSVWTIKDVSYEIRNILQNSAAIGWNSYRDVISWYEAQGRSKNALRHKKHTIRMIERYDLKGAYPDGMRHSRLFENDAYLELPSEFRELIEFSYQYRLSNNVQKNTVYCEASASIIFFRFLQKQGCSCLDDILEKDVLAFFLPESENGAGYAARQKIAATLESGINWKEVPCKKLLVLLPVIRRSRRIIQYLTQEETEQIRDVLSCMENGLSYRDRAIGMLLLYTGLRACDIAGLYVESIDWDRDMLHILQKKTDVPLDLPLSAVVGNAIFEYLTKERPVSSNPHLFLTEVDSQRSLDSASIGNVVNRIFRIANIRQKDGDRRGTHIFRHHAVSQMLENGVPLSVISRTLGHTSPTSVNPYLAADFKHLKECAISIAGFPVSEEVLPL